MSLPESNQVILEAKHVSKSFSTHSGSLNLFKDLNLTIHRGETLAIVGRSGAGKSTLLSLLAGLDTPTSGQIYLNAQDLASMNDKERADLRVHHISFIFQSFHLLPELSALDNVRLALEIRSDPKANEQARYWLEQVGLGERVEHFPSQLSGGEQQRVAIARAFATNPSILFADEPTGNLDDETGQQIIEKLFELNAKSNTTLLLITHDTQLATRCQRRITLQQGQITEASSS